MSGAARAAWLKLVAEPCIAAALLLTATPAPVDGRLPGELDLAVGLGAGALLSCALAGRFPAPARIPRARRSLVIAKGALLCLSAACEEVVWRWFAIGALASRTGLGAAFSASTIGFALAHLGQGVRAVPVHLVTGAAFGAVFILTGSLAAAALAHASYNVGVLLVSETRGAARPISGSP